MCWDLLRWAKDVAFNPEKNTKKEMKYEVFVKKLATISLGTGVLTSLITIAFFSGELTALSGQLFWLSAFVSIPVYLLAAIVGPFVSAAVLHFFGKFVFRLMSKGYEKTYNASAYAMVPKLLFAWIPVVGPFVGGIWGLVVGIYALANHQKITRGRAVLVTFIPIIIALVVIGILVALAASFVAGALVGPQIMNAVLGTASVY